MRFYKNFVFNQSFKVIWFILVLAAGRLASPQREGGAVAGGSGAGAAAEARGAALSHARPLTHRIACRRI